VVLRIKNAIQAHYKAKPEDAKALIAVGESKPDAALDPADLATWTMVCNQMLNLDETSTSKRGCDGPFQPVRRLSRRQFFTGGANLMGAAAMASLLGSGASADDGKGPASGSAPLRPEGQAGHLPAHGRRPAQMDLFDYKPEMQNDVRQGPAPTRSARGSA
jgi:hypothetical protein